MMGGERFELGGAERSSFDGLMIEFYLEGTVEVEVLEDH